MPAEAVLDEFEYIILDGAKEKPEAIPIFQKLVEKYHPGFLIECRHALALSESIAQKILKRNMLKNKSDEEIEKIVNSLNDHFENKTHSRHIHSHQAKEMGLIIKDIENNQELQDTILSIHHLYMHTFQQTPASKIIENHAGSHMIIST